MGCPALLRGPSQGLSGPSHWSCGSCLSKSSQPRPDQCSEHTGCQEAVSIATGVSRNSFATSQGLWVHVLHCLFSACWLDSLLSLVWKSPFLAQVVHPIASLPFRPSNALDPRWPSWASADDGPVIFTISLLSTSCFVTWDESQPQFSHL